MHIYISIIHTINLPEGDIFAGTFFCDFGQCTNICDLYADTVKGRQILMFGMHIANVGGYKILRVWAHPQKYQMLVPAKIEVYELTTS